MESHLAMIGTAYVMQDYPLYYEAVNEKGLGMAALNFVGNACYFEPRRRMNNIPQFEFIPFVLGSCSTLKEVKKKLENLNLTNIPFSKELPIAQLHWIIADKSGAITVESVKDGIKVYENRVGVLTNNPPFCEQMFALNNYMHLSNKPSKNLFLKDIPLKEYSRGMGAIGLPGDWSSQSRFIRTVFTRNNSVSGNTETESVGQFFHILDSVTQIKGCCELETNKYEITLYSSCCNADKGIYYYTTYYNRQITGVNIFAENLDSENLIRYGLIKSQQFKMQN
jgi:choloylglycine hydrolase